MDNFGELIKKYNEIEAKLAVLQTQYDTLKNDNIDLKTQCARLSTENMKLQSKYSAKVVQENQVFINDQYESRQNILYAFDEEIVRNAYTMITDNVAIGNYASPYEAFDIVINICFLGNSTKYKHHDMATNTHNGRQITHVAMYDSPDEKVYMKMTLHSIIPVLIHHIKRNPLIKVLFHCFAGVSRSGSFGVAFVAHLEGYTYEEALQKVKEKRPQVDPNPGFVEAIKEYLEEIRQVESMVIV